MSNFYDVELRCEVQAIVGVYAESEVEAMEQATDYDLPDIEVYNLVDSEAVGIKRTAQAR